MRGQERRPILDIWFGNFYEPAYSDAAFVEHSLEEIRRLGFDSVMLDSKSWQDFFERAAGGEASPYVAMQEHMIRLMRDKGLRHRFLAIYMNGDNLYPTIRFSPPVVGEGCVGADGSEIRWYRYWSERAQQSMIDHVRGLFARHADNHAELLVDGEVRRPICSMWDPIAIPSFDEEGRARYFEWLEVRYGGDIRALNEAYGANHASFAEMDPRDWWFSQRFGPDAMFDEADIRDGTPIFRMWTDNMRWRRDEVTRHFAAMRERFRVLDPSLWLSPNLTQWSLYLNIDACTLQGLSFGDLWDTANRGIDPFEIEPHVDNCSFTTVPVTPMGDPDAYVSSLQNSMIRGMNRGREFCVGLFLGRFLYNDVYRFLTPAEMLATAAASGSSGVQVYGWCGLDDGGIMHRMGAAYLDSIRLGNEWLRRVIPLTGKRRPARVAILYPAATALLEPYAVPGSQERRMDLLGWYRSACDAGYMVDIVHPRQLVEGVLEDVRVLILPADDCWRADRNPSAEAVLGRWTKSGGCVVHGPGCGLAAELFGVPETPVAEGDSVAWREGMLVSGSVFSGYPVAAGKKDDLPPLRDVRRAFEAVHADNGAFAEEALSGTEIVARWIDAGLPAITVRARGRGAVVSFGYRHGFSFVSRIAPHVPHRRRNAELYPVRWLKEDPLATLLTRFAEPDAPECAGSEIEAAVFANGRILVNHSVHAWRIPPIRGERIFQLEGDPDHLAPHAAVFIRER